MGRYRGGPSENVLIVLMFIGLFSFMVGIVWFMAHNEAASYNKFCDTPVTTWDAVFLDLRIDECQCNE